MSILTDHTAETGAPEAGFDMFASREYVAPRANLLPPEIAERAALRRITAAMIAAVVACGGIVGAVYVSTESGKAPANRALASAQAERDSLAAQQKVLAPSQTAHAQVLAAKKSLQAAMGSEVLWSDQLNVLRGDLIDGVRLSTLTVTETLTGAGGTAGSSTSVTLPAAPAGSGTAAAAGTTAATAAAASTGIATVSMNGVAVSTDKVADWLDTLATMPGWANVYLSSVTQDTTYAGLYNFTITANITDKALSHRYTNGG
jgi:Tfp pilus assembly protein PilN